MIKILLVAIIIDFLILVSTEHICNSHTYIYKIPGDVIFIGIFGIHSGTNCTEIETKTLQITESLITAVDATRNSNILPGLNIGLLLYDTCSQKEIAQKVLISGLVEAECSQSTVIGGVMMQETEFQIKNVSSTLGLPLIILDRGPDNILRAQMIVSILHDLHWTSVNYFISNNADITKEFMLASVEQRICIENNLKSKNVTEVRPGSTVVVMMDFTEIEEILTHLHSCKVLLVPLDGRYHHITNIESLVFIVLPSTLETHNLSSLYNLTLDESAESVAIKELTISRSSLLQVQTMSDMLSLLTTFRSHLKEHCQNSGTRKVCSHMPKFYKNPLNINGLINGISSIKYHLQILKLNVNDFEGAIIIEQKTDLKKLGSLRISEGRWALDIEFNIITDNIKLCAKNEANNSSDLDCSSCFNYNFLHKTVNNGSILNIFKAIKIREEAWVAALLSISTVGILCCIAIAIFIIVRIYKKDMLEGNPGFSFLMLFSIIFMYIALLPFSFEVVDDDQNQIGIFCRLRIFGTSLSYSLVFSVMLSRSLMLACADDDSGFMSHINGYLQTILCFFIALVQIALTFQFWTINWVLISKDQCINLSRGSLFLLLLSYDMFLLILLLCVSPFIIKSKRNYHEGSYFAVSSVFCLLVWLVWCTGYLLLSEWEDIFVCFGLVATATTILVIVFIPRTYLMLTGIVRDHLVSTLPSLGHTTSTSVIDINYRSTQALYDSVTIPRGSTTPNYYTERPTTPSTSKLEEDRIQDGAYERYSPSPSPLNITRF